jgi:hypothetical protein
MSAAPDPAELAPSRDPAAYGRRPMRGAGVAGWLVLCLICVTGGVAFGRFGLPAAPAKPDTPAADTAPRATGSPSAVWSPSPPSAGQPPTAVPANADPGLADRVARLEASASRGDLAAAEALGAASLSIAAEGSGPFDRDVAAFARLAPDDPDLRALQPLAAAGAPSRTLLAAALPDNAAAAALALREPDRDAGFLARLWAILGRVVIVRQVDPAAPGPDGALAKAEAQSSAGDLEGAVQTLRSLPRPARAALSGWLSAADRRIEIDQRIAAIRARALAALAPTAPAAPPAPRA